MDTGNILYLLLQSSLRKGPIHFQTYLILLYFTSSMSQLSKHQPHLVFTGPNNLLLVRPDSEFTI